MLIMSSAKREELFIHHDVLCVKRYFDYTLAGIGSNLFVYSDESLLLSEPVFIGERIHSLLVKNDLIFVKGGRQLALVKLNKIFDQFECQVLSKIESSDWIQAVVVFNDKLAGVVTAHNLFEYWDLEAKKHINACSCEERCILYCCTTLGDTMENLVVFAGTVFGNFLIWSPCLKENQTLQNIKGHNGAIFSIDVKPKEKLLATTSDDRSLKIWSVDTTQTLLCPKNWKNSEINLMHTLFGHTARVWRSLILTDFYLTIGEDSKLIVWSKDGGVVKSLSLHQESGIRALDYSKQDDVITTGGEDGAINAFQLKSLITEHEGMRMLNLGQSVSTKVCFSSSGLVYTLNGGCILVTDEGEEEVVYKNEIFSSYCVLEISYDGDYIIIGSIKGFLVVVSISQKDILVEQQIISGRIYSIHWLGQLLMTCGPVGRLDLWELSNGGLKNVATKTLPESKERWTTCAAVENDKLILGDRMGNIHIYTLLKGEEPVKSFRKIHSYLGVTDIMINDNDWLTVGRDGTVKEFGRDLNHLKTSRLPMDWPWKLVRYREDILILGFHGVSFIVWSTRYREVIASHECGGGHRSCDYKIEKNKLSFLYVKDKKVFVVDLALDEIKRIRSGFHGKEINCLKILQTEPMIILTGSEDTTLRISKFDKIGLKLIEVLKTHISSVRALCTSPTETGHLIISVGGKGQIVFWDFNSKTLKCREVVTYRLRKENKKSSTPSILPETRVMCADIMRSGNEYIIATGCSDCQIRLFSYNVLLYLNVLLCEISTHHCILKVALLTVSSSRVLLSMGTDGRVVFWDVTYPAVASRLASYPLHQSGINSFDMREIETGKFVLATGGDDNFISVAFARVTEGKVDLKRIWGTRTAHSCQITGIKILKNYLVTTSIDQRITLWELEWEKEKLKPKFLNQWLTVVADVQGMDAAPIDDGRITVAVHGAGLEILNLFPVPQPVDCLAGILLIALWAFLLIGNYKNAHSHIIQEIGPSIGVYLRDKEFYFWSGRLIIKS